jgi:paraquat-inducible protein B
MTEEVTPPEAATPEEPRAVVRYRRRWSTVWIVPGIALILAGWLVWKHYHDRGELAHISFETADSIIAGKTEVRCRSVRIGIVESVELAGDLRSVYIGVRIAPDNASLLRAGSRFWVVRPRVSGSELSGLGTLITGSYIEMEPGDGASEIHHFAGLEEPPVTSANVPGLRLTLTAEDAGSLSVGSPMYYHGFEVGRVERRTFDIEHKNIRFEVFIEEKYAALVHTGTCFWNTSGIDIAAGADGFQVHTPSLQAMVSGGASFGVPKDGIEGDPVKDGANFHFFKNENAARESIFAPDHRSLLLFDQSVRGLKVGAPVEFRGIQVGRVADISMRYAAPGDSRVPVIVELEVDNLRTASQQTVPSEQALAEAVKAGLRAKLATGSLLTGALYIDLDFAPDAPAASLTQSGEFDVIPTLSSGLAQLETKVNSILAKIDALPLDTTFAKFGNAADEIATTVADARSTLAEAEKTLVEARKILASDSTQNLTTQLDATLKQMRSSVESFGPTGAVQGDLRRTLDELRASLRAFKTLSDSIEEKPSSLLFGKDSSGNPIPRARKN